MRTRLTKSCLARTVGHEHCPILLDPNPWLGGGHVDGLGIFDPCDAVAFIQFVESCLVLCLGLPLTLGAIYGLYSQVRNGEVAPIYVINLLISDLIQFCCMIVEVAQPEDEDVFNSEYWGILHVFHCIYIYSLVASVGFMVVIALERYLVVVHPLWYHFRRTIKSSVLVCVLVWILPAVTSLIFIISYDFMVLVFTIFFLLPLPLLIFFLIATLKALYASISVPNDEKRRIAGMLILVLLIYTLLFLPNIILLVDWSDYVFNPNGHKPHLGFLEALAPVFAKLSPLADLVLYMLMRKGTIRQLSACLCRCRTDSNEIRSVTVNDVNMSTVTSSQQRNMEREGERTEGKL
ncbi:ovarian cancer G-protein coupled receptor 1-like [Centropristis striata]|uniref:ovarian cancer G-protein coupled receptor 1-like n=1 Tax=Centropristis striata TaxID=184440 RepID=UPI0027DFDA32|nr:ovarian cancer G-protein coupled receptor 1-like [Centropristis striata]